MIKALENLRADLKKEGNNDVIEYVDDIIKYAGKKKKAIYTAAFLTPESREDLYKWWASTIKTPLKERVPGHSHMTIKWKPHSVPASEDGHDVGSDLVTSLPIGEADKSVTVVGYSEDEFGQAVHVVPSDQSFARQDEGHEHITISASGAAPGGFSYSNALLDKGITAVDGPTLEVRVGFFNGKEVRYDFDGSIYFEEELDLGE
jgi:hypothetical protein